MKKPPALLTLLEDLKNEIPTSSVQTVSGSKAYIYLDEHAVATEDSIILKPTECELLFDSKETVELLVEALGRPSDASIELHEIELSLEVLDVLASRFVAVDEI